VKVNGKELAVEVTGEGPVVLLVHGLGGTSNFYQPQVAALAERFTVVRPDMEGSGRSTVRGRLTIQGFANDLADLLTSLDAGPARVVGHSMGTITVRLLAATHPELVSHLALLGAVPAPLPEAGQQAQHDRAAKARAGEMPAIADAVMGNATAEATRRDHPATAAAVRELVLRQDPEGYARSCEALAAANDPGPISRELPLLLLTGADDGVGAPAVTHALAEAHGSAVVDVFDDCGHWHALERPHEVTEHLLKFF
jgi:pimeloyl-ACP methyl ester carboxylesterase